MICPPSAGVASALGLLVAPARVDRVATVGLRLDRDSGATLESAFRRLEDEARAVMADTGLKLETATVRRLADGRFLGQGFDLVVELPDGPYDDTDAGRRTLTAAFETAYREKFALTPPGRAGGVHQHPRGGAGAGGGASRSPAGASGQASGGGRAVKGGAPRTSPSRAASCRDDRCTTARRLAGRRRSRGPAVVEEEGSTLVVGPGATARVAPSGNIVVTLGVQRQRLDAVTLEVLWTRIISVVDEAAKAIVRTSFSTLSNEANDFACVLTDARGIRARAEHAAASRPSSGPCRPRCATSSARWAPTRMRPGDVLITNDPWMGTGHMSDVCVSSRSSPTAGSWRSPPPPRTCRTSAGACAPSRRARSSRKASTSRSPS